MPRSIPQTFLLDFPGGNDDVGHREIPEEMAGGYDNHVNPLFGADNTQGVTTILYNFKADYGWDDQGQPLKNLITETPEAACARGVRGVGQVHRRPVPGDGQTRA